MEIAEAAEGPGDLRPPEQTLSVALEGKPSPHTSCREEPACQERLPQHCLLTCSNCSQWSSSNSPDLQGKDDNHEQQLSSCSHGFYCCFCNLWLLLLQLSPRPEGQTFVESKAL